MQAYPGGPAPTAAPETLIVHHLSDLHRGRASGARHPLDLYVQRHRRLPAEKKPNLIIVTGDLTVSGSRDELHEVSQVLQGLALDWDALAQRQRIFVVPGPHDLDWANQAATFDEFRQEFQQFCIPAFTGRDGAVFPGPEPYAQSLAEHVIIYLVNTCHSPESLPRQLPRPLDDLLKRYRELWRERARRPNAAFDASVRAQFLEVTQELIARDAGVVSAADREHFARVMQSLHLDDLALSASFPGDDGANPLRILATHHPLIAHAGHDGKAYQAAAGAGELLRLARRYGFTVALHGHTHEPHVLSDLPVDAQATEVQQPTLQIGAGSMSGVRRDEVTFNEILATRHHGSGRWTLEMAAVAVDADIERPPLRFTLLNPVGEMANLRLSRQDTTGARATLEYRLRIAMRLFIDALEDDTLDIPVRPLEAIKDAIKEVVFQGIETRIGLALKQRPQTNGPIILENRYIVPDAQFDEQYLHPFSYPDTVAAWALIQGEALIYPREFRDETKLVNFDWLARSGKFDGVLKLLKDQAAHGGPAAQRAATLAARMESRTLRLVDIYQPSPPSPQPTRFPSFICVPIPLRTSSVVAQRQRELGVLSVDVNDPDRNDPGGAFTEERIDMLRTVANLLDVILTTANKLRKPRGVWATV